MNYKRNAPKLRQTGRKVEELSFFFLPLPKEKFRFKTGYARPGLKRFGPASGAYYLLFNMIKQLKPAAALLAGLLPWRDAAVQDRTPGKIPTSP